MCGELHYLLEVLRQIFSEEKINFSVAAAPDSVCELCLYKKGYTEPFSVCELEQEPLIGNVRFVAVEGLGGDVEYLYRIRW